jgi:carboxymethylenebutenolidase
MGVQAKLPSDIEGLAKMVPPFSRRGFMTTSAAAAAGYTLLAGPVRADAIKTDTNGLTVGDGKVKVAGGEMPVYFAKPANVANPPVILVAMEIFGVHEYIRDVTRRLAHLGALAIAPDYYFRAGVDLTKIDDLQKLFPIVNAKPDKELFADLDATVDWAKQQGGDTNRLGIMGFCRGGRTVWLYSTHNAASNPMKSTRWRPSSRQRARPPNSTSMTAPRTASTPTTARATARRKPSRPGASW